MYKKDSRAIKLIQDREAYLKLTPAQAEKVLAFEKESEGEPFFSTWEEFDYQLDFYKSILTENQFTKFKKEIDRRKKIAEKSMAEKDAFYSNQVKCNTRKLKYIKSTFLPALFKDVHLPPEFLSGALSAYQSKIDLVRSAYQEYWQKTRKEILTNHYRHCRTLKPTELKNALLLHDISRNLPDSYFFKFRADEPTRATINYLIKHLSAHFKVAEPVLDKKYEALTDYSNKLWEKHVGGSPGFRISLGPKKKEMFEHKLMSFLLIDPKLFR